MAPSEPLGVFAAALEALCSRTCRAAAFPGGSGITAVSEILGFIEGARHHRSGGARRSGPSLSAAPPGAPAIAKNSVATGPGANGADSNVEGAQHGVERFAEGDVEGLGGGVGRRRVGLNLRER